MSKVFIFGDVLIQAGIYRWGNWHMINDFAGIRATPKSSMTASNEGRTASTAVRVTAVPGFLPSSPSISLLARQLEKSAALEALRNKSLDRSQLAQEANRLLDQILGDFYQGSKALHNEEIGNADDPDVQLRARQATAYVVSSDSHDRATKSPFFGLSREQLNLIVYDDSGSFTVNERRAAWYGVSDIESAWNRQLMFDAKIESAHNAGQTPRFYAKVIAHYNALPLIEQVQYPDDYVAKALAHIDQANNPVKKREPKLLTLFEILAIMLKRKKIGEAEEGEKSPVITNSAGAESATAACNS